MAADRLILALDQGTTSSRAIAFGRDGRPVAAAQQAFEQRFPSPGHVTHDPEAIWSSQLAVAQQVVREVGGADRIAAIGITNQRETTIVWDRATGEPIADAIVWQSRITAPACERLRLAGHEALFRERTGLPLDAYFSGPKIAAILDAVPGARSRAERGELAFGTVDSFLLWRLTGGSAAAPAPSTRRTSRMPAGRCCSTSIGSTGTTSCSSSSACHGRCCQASGPRADRSARPPRSSSAGRSRSLRWPATSRPRPSARPASSRARRRTPTERARSCS